MKKMFVALCSLLPGGFVLLATMLMFAACARLQYQDPAGNIRIDGLTMTPEAAMIVSAEAEAVRAEAYATRKCSDDPRNCGAVLGSWGAGLMDAPAGYTWAGIRAVTGGDGTGSNGDIRRDVAEIKKQLNAVNKGQDAFLQALKNRKKGN